MTAPNLVLCEVFAASDPGLETFSPFCLKVHRALRLAGLPYVSRRGRMPADFRALNPTAQVPVLLVGDEPVYDSTRILSRIAELSPGALDAEDPRTNAEAWLWEDWADRALNGFVVASRWADRRNWPRVREAFFGHAPWLVRTVIAPRIRRRVEDALVARDVLRAGQEALWSDYRRILDALERRAPRSGFWLGARMTVADLGLFAQLRSLKTSLSPWQARELELRPQLVDWLDRVDAATRAPAAEVVPIRKAS